MRIEVQEVDEEWTHWAKCPAPECKVVTHACCRGHAIEGIWEHISESHA